MVKSPSSEYYSPKTRILLISPPPVNTYQRGADLASRNPPRKCDREFEFTKLYAEAVTKTAQEEGVAVADLWSVIWEAAGKDERALSAYLLDGLHLNAKGYEVWSHLNVSEFSLITCPSLAPLQRRQRIHREIVPRHPSR